MASLRLFSVEIIHSDGSSELKTVLGYNACHAVNLLYRYLDSIGLFHKSRHGLVIECKDFLSPSYFKDGSK